MVTTLFLEMEKTTWRRCWRLYKKVNYLQSETRLLSKGHDNLEILFVEIGRRNKNTPSVICAAYQPNSNEI